jgi:O-antigen/teichoic acid export membrane protein
MLTTRLRHVWNRSSAALRAAPLLSIGGLSGLMLLLNVGISLLLVRYLPKESYGQLVYFYAGVGLTRLLMNFGLGQYISRELASVGDQPEALRRAVYSTLTIRAASIVLMWLVIVLVNAFTDQPFLFYIALTGFFASLADMALAVVSGLHLTASIALITAAQPVLYGLLAVGFMLLGQTAAELLMLLVALSYVGTAGTAVVVLIRSRRITMLQRGDLDFTFIVRIIADAIPIYAISLISQAYLSFNSGFLGAQGDFIASANYGAAFNLMIMTLGLSTTALLSIFYPRITQAAATENRPMLMQHIHDTLTLNLRVYLFIIVLLAAFPETVVSILYGTAYERSAVYLLGLAPTAAIISTASIFTQILISQRRQWLAVLGLGLQTLMLFIVSSPTTELTASRLVEATLVSTIFGMLLLLGCTIWVLRMLPFRRRDLAVIILAVVCTLVLRQVQFSVGTSLSIWHIVAGVVFTLVYWLSTSMGGRMPWRTRTS